MKSGDLKFISRTFSVALIVLLAFVCTNAVASEIEYYDENHIMVDGMIMSIDYIESQFKPRPAILRWEQPIYDKSDAMTEGDVVHFDSCVRCRNEALTRNGFKFLNVSMPGPDPRKPILEIPAADRKLANREISLAYRSVLHIRRPDGQGKVRAFSGVLTESSDTVLTSAHEVFLDYPKNTKLYANVSEMFVYFTSDLRRAYERYQVVGVIPYDDPEKFGDGEDLVLLKIEPIDSNKIPPRRIRAVSRDEFEENSEIIHVAFHRDRDEATKKLVQVCSGVPVRPDSPIFGEKGVAATSCWADKGSSGGGNFVRASSGEYYLEAIQRGYLAPQDGAPYSQRTAYSTIIDAHAAEFIKEGAMTPSYEAIRIGFKTLHQKQLEQPISL